MSTLLGVRPVGYEVHDVNGYLEGGPTISGRSQLQRFFDGEDAARYPAMDQLLTHGVTDQPKMLRTEARALARKVTDVHVRTTLESLARCAAKADEIVALVM